MGGWMRKKGFGHSLEAVIFTNRGVSYDLFSVSDYGAS